MAISSGYVLFWAVDNIYGAGLAQPINSSDSRVACHGQLGSVGAAGSPPPHLSIPENATAIYFPSVTGAFGCCGRNTGISPNGGHLTSIDGTSDVDSFGGISAFRHDAQLPLVGVFLAGGVQPATAPPRIDPAQWAGWAQPRLGQVFAVGDGQGTPLFFAPPGATDLYLGFACAKNFIGPPGCFQWNMGGGNASFEWLSATPPPPPPAVPGLSATLIAVTVIAVILVLCGGYALVGATLRWRRRQPLHAPVDDMATSTVEVEEGVRATASRASAPSATPTESPPVRYAPREGVARIRLAADRDETTGVIRWPVNEDSVGTHAARMLRRRGLPVASASANVDSDDEDETRNLNSS